MSNFVLCSWGNNRVEKTLVSDCTPSCNIGSKFHGLHPPGFIYWEWWKVTMGGRGEGLKEGDTARTVVMKEWRRKRKGGAGVKREKGRPREWSEQEKKAREREEGEEDEGTENCLLVREGGTDAEREARVSRRAGNGNTKNRERDTHRVWKLMTEGKGENMRRYSYFLSKGLLQIIFNRVWFLQIRSIAGKMLYHYGTWETNLFYIIVRKNLYPSISLTLQWMTLALLSVLPINGITEQHYIH